ncbi:MAG: Tetratricopeptide repeat protein [Candidatus Aerophobetes bacterium ADurb.Bin490]|nr:MAG: Tetratricopeptide repeat protein [Candidatus Aerophobetes bacterium ADurb.Bin490]
MISRKYLPQAAFAAVLLSIFAVILTTVPPAVFSGDSGETITASVTLGIQHPPGYPVFSLLGKIFSFIPFADYSFRIYLLSILLSLICGVLIFILFKMLAGSHTLPAAAAAVFFMTGYSIWDQSNTAKGGIYILNIAFTLSLLIICFKASAAGSDSGKLKFLRLFSLIYGLSFGNHHMSQLIMFPVYILIITGPGFKQLLRPKAVLSFILFFIAGFSIYLYLPVRTHNAVLNWGDPSNLENFFRVFTRYQYVRGEIAKSINAPLMQSAKFFSSLAREHSIAGPILASAGFVFLFIKNKKTAIALALIPALFLIVTAFYLNLPKERLYIMETYITPVYLSLAFFMAYGIFAALSLIKNKKLAAAAAIAFFAAFFARDIISSYPMLNRSAYFFSRDFNLNLFSSVEKNSLLFVTGDGIVFPSWYLKYVKKIRPDIVIIGSAVLPMQWVRDSITKQDPSVKVPVIKEKKIGTESTGYIINALIKMNISSRNIYFSYNKPEDNALNGGFKIMPKGMAWRVLPSDYAVVSEQYTVSVRNMWKYYYYRNMLGTYPGKFTQPNESLYLQDLGTSANSAGVFFEDSGYNNLALEYFTLAHRLQPQNCEFIYNMGNASFNLGDLKMAEAYYLESLGLDPLYVSSWHNLGVAYYKSGRYSEALGAFKKIKEIDPSRSDINGIISVLEKIPTPAQP